MRNVLRLLVILMVGVWVLSAYGVEYEFTTLDYPGATSTTIQDLEEGTYVGYCSGGAVLPSGFVYDGEVWTELAIPMARAAEPIEIENGIIAGIYYDEEGFSHGFVYNGTSWTTIDYPGAEHTEVLGIEGDIIAGNYWISSGQLHGFIYDGTEWRTLDFPGSIESAITGMDGHTIVGRYDDGNSMFHHGFCYDGTNWITLDYPGGYATPPRGIDGDLIIGNYQTQPGDWGKVYGFIYDRTTTTWTTLAPPGSGITIALGIEDGTIVGDYHSGDLDDQIFQHGFIATPIQPLPRFHINDIRVSSYSRTWWRYPYSWGVGLVQMVDQDGAPVAAVTVTGQWSEGAQDSDSFTTNENGWGWCFSDWSWGEPVFRFCVTDSAKPEWVHDPEANVMTCGSSE